MFTISEITYQIKNILEENFENIELIGEISNYTKHKSGHHYFVLKDNNAQINAILWRSANLNFVLKDGMKVIVKGNIEVYPPQGKYQIICKLLKPAGEGDLYLALEALKEKLKLLGYFDSNRKKKLPVFPLKIGISTSPTGEAINDLISTIKRRNNLLTIYFRPTLVQGDGAAEDIAKAIEDLHKFDCNVIIIGRGGGSIEDLWAYNTEIVANAIYNSRIPIISAVGHEGDLTISDLVADIRASTPTAAAEIVTKITRDDLLKFLDESNIKITTKITNLIELYKEKLDDRVKKRMIRRVESLFNIEKQKLDYFSSILFNNMNNKLNLFKNKTNSLYNILNANNPINPLNKGFALLKYNNKFISKNKSLLEFEDITIVRQNENVIVKILEKV